MSFWDFACDLTVPNSNFFSRISYAICLFCNIQKICLNVSLEIYCSDYFFQWRLFLALIMSADVLLLYILRYELDSIDLERILSQGNRDLHLSVELCTCWLLSGVFPWLLHVESMAVSFARLVKHCVSCLRIKQFRYPRSIIL